MKSGGRCRPSGRRGRNGARRRRRRREIRVVPWIYLMAAAQAFPGNPAVSKALAAGFVQAGQPKDAMAIYQALDMTNATPSDYQSMVGAAIAVQNMKQAEAWLRDALGKFPNDAKVLASAAQFEQARGDRARAADYWRASLNAMPSATPTATLAHELDQSDLVKQTRPAKPTDLVNLLNPDQDATVEGEAGVPLPSYSNPSPTRASNQPLGPDPYYMGTAPVQIYPIGPGKRRRGERAAAGACAELRQHGAGNRPDHATHRKCGPNGRRSELAGPGKSESCASGDEARDPARQACATANEAVHTAGVSAAIPKRRRR